MHARAINLIVPLAIASLAIAQTSTVTLYIPGADPQPLEASVIATVRPRPSSSDRDTNYPQGATATTYALQCVPGTDGSNCGLPGIVTLTEGPATAAYTFPAQLDANGSLALYVLFPPLDLKGADIFGP